MRKLSLSCPQGQFDNNGSCAACSSCSFCNSLTSYSSQRDCFYCLSKPPYSMTYRLDGSCSPGCPPGQSYNVWALACTIGCDTSQCVCQNSQCKSCLNSAYTIYSEYNTCYLCDSNSTKVGSICLKCNIKQFVDLPNKKCTNCDSQFGGACEKCNDQTCLSCPSSACFDSFERKICTSPSFDTQKIGDICITLQPSCKSYSAASLREDKKQIVCDECVNPSYVKFADGSCQPSCTTKHEMFEGVCTSCQNNCLKCPNLVECSQCDTNYFILNNSTCVSKTDCLKNLEYTANTTTKICEKCKTDAGYFFSSSTCSKCEASCKTCSGSLYNQCKSCYDGAILLPDNTCFACAVNDGYFLDTNKNCLKCDGSCKSCNGPAENNCTACNGNLVLDPITNKCVCNIANCSQCTIDGSSCLHCNQGYAGNQCSDCNAITTGKYVENNICKDCDNSCKTCNGPLQTDCIDCKISAFKVEPATRLCQCAINKCKTCNSDGTQCQECQDGYTYQNGTCQFCDISNKQFIDSLKVCQNCHQSCKKCIGLNETDCTECIQNGFKVDNISKICACQFDNCLECSIDGLSCSKCQNGYTFVNNQCTFCDINNGYYIDSNNVCIKCEGNCKTCNGSTKYDCLTCAYANHKLDSITKLCTCYIDNCKVCSDFGTSCNECQSGFVPSQDKCIFCDTNNKKYIDNNICYPCHESCQKCHGPTEKDCDICSIALFQKDPNNFGICSCSITNCKKCNDNGSTCLKCNDNYLIDGNACKYCDVQNGYYFNQTQKTCTKCHENCKTCHGTSQMDCDQCSNPNFQVDVNNSNQCSCKIKDCLECSDDGSKCKICKDKYYFDGIECKLCDTTEFNYNNQNQLCYKCHNSCSTCSGPTEKDCIVCANPLFIKNSNNVCTCSITNCKQCSKDGNLCLECNDKYVVNSSSKCTFCDIQNQLFFNKQNDLCQKCHDSCKTCSGDQQNECIQCKYQGQQLDKNQNCSCPIGQCLICQPNSSTNCSCSKCECNVKDCEDCTSNDKNICQTCKLNFLLKQNGQVCEQIMACKVSNCKECQQNTSTICKQCNNGFILSDKADICKQKTSDVKYAFKSSFVLFKDGYKITILFEKPIALQKEELDEVIKFRITNIKDTDYKYQIEKKNEKEILITLYLGVDCKKEIFYIKIADDQFAQVNHLSKLEDDLYLDTYIKLSEKQIAQKQNIQTASKTITQTVIGTIIPLALLGNFYIVFSMLDITGLIYYLLYLDVRYPFNVLSFCDIFQNFQFAFIPNMLLYFLDPNYSQWAPKKFIENQSDGYFLHGAGQSFTIIGIIMSIYLTMKLMSLIPIKKLQDYVLNKIKGGWEYSGFIDLIWSVYLYVLISCLLQFYSFEIYDNSSYFNYILFAICTVAVFFIPIKFTRIIYKSRNIKDDTFMNERLGSLIGGLKLFNQDENIIHQEQEKVNQYNSNEKGNQENNDGIKSVKKLSQVQNGESSPQKLNGTIEGSISPNKSNKNLEESLSPKKVNCNQEGGEEFDIKSLMHNSMKSLDQFKHYSTAFASGTSSTVNLLDHKSTREQLQIQFSKYTNMILYLRKIIFSFIIVFLHEYTYVQIGLLIPLTLFVGVYYLYIMPQTSYFDNLKNGISELILILIIISAAILKDEPKDQSEDTRIQIGWIFVSCTAFIILVQAIDLIFELLRSLLSRFIQIFRKKVAKTAPIVEQRAKKRKLSSRPNINIQASQLINIQFPSNKFISSQLSLKSNDQLRKQDDFNQRNDEGESPSRIRVLDGFEQNSPVKSTRKRRTFLQHYGQNRQLSLMPTAIKSNTNIISHDQDSAILEMSNNLGLQPASASRSYIEEHTARQLNKM